MPLVDELTRSGKWLFRWRSYLPLVLVAMVVVSMTHARAAGGPGDGMSLWELVCIGTSLFGFLIRAKTVGHTPRGTSGRNTRSQIAETLNTTGTYSTVRHPLYVGNFFMGLGVALFPGLWAPATVYTLAFWLYYERIMMSEEAFLIDRFGSEYLTWAASTPAFIPRLSQYRPAALPFSLRNVMRREYNGLFAVAVLMSLLEVVGDWAEARRLSMDPEWEILFVASLVVWIIARTLKRHTRTLNVPGR